MEMDCVRSYLGRERHLSSRQFPNVRAPKLQARRDELSAYDPK